MVKWLLYLIACSIVVSSFVRGQTSTASQQSEERVIVVLRGSGLTPREVELIIKGEEHYFPALESFNTFGIKSQFDSLQQHISGFFKNTDSTYQIDFVKRQATFRGKTIPLTDRDFLFRNNKVYLNLIFFNEFFGIELVYNSHTVQVTIKNAFNLPTVVVARRLRALEQRQKVFNKIPDADLDLGGDKSFLSGGLINYSTNETFSQYNRPSARSNFNIGVKALGGDFTGRLYNVIDLGKSTSTFTGNYRYPIFGNSWVTQITGGDILDLGVFPQQITGVAITNQPVAPRRIFTQEVFQGNVDPKMDVAFYGTIGEAALQTADEHGQYQFDIPVMYGNGEMELHAYDSWGQEKTIRYRLDVPNTMIPPGQFQYSFSLGKNREQKNSPFVVTNLMNWGLTPELTIGSISSFYDFTNTNNQQGYTGITSTARLLNALVANATFIPQAYSLGSLSWDFTSNARLSVENSWYAGSSQLNPTGIVDVLDISASVPLNLFSRGTFFNVLGLETSYTNSRTDELQVSVATTISTIQPSLSSEIVTVKDYGDGTSTQTYQTTAALSFIMPAGLHVLTDMTYDNLAQALDEIDLFAVERFGGFGAEFSYNRSYTAGSYLVGLKLTYYPSFTRVSVGASTNNSDRLDYSAAAYGNISFTTSPFNVRFSSTKTNLFGNGSFFVSAFLDSNGNGVKDKNEPTIDVGRVYISDRTVPGYPAHIPVNSVTQSKIFSYEDYTIFLDPETLEDPVWVPQYRAINLIAEPNLLRRIDIPVVNGGILRGTVTIAAKTTLPAEGITITVTSTKETVGPHGEKRPSFVKTASTFSTGEFEFLAIPPGKYILSLDATQLSGLAFTSNPANRDIEIVMKPDGDIINDQNFTLLPKR